MHRSPRFPVRQTAAAAVLAGAILFLVSPRAHSFVGAAGERVIISEPQWDDAYLAGAKIIVDEEIGGDIVMAGASLISTAPVAGDLNAVGVSIVVNGIVGDDVRALGGDVNIGRDVGSDLAAFGGSVSVSPKVIVGGDAALAAGNIHFSGTSAGSAWLAGGRVSVDGVIRGDATIIALERIELNGTVEGTARIAAPEIVLGADALFGGDVEYWRESGNMEFGRTLRSGEATYNPELSSLAGGGIREKFGRHGASGLLLFWAAGSTAAAALCVLLFLVFGRGYFQAAAVTLQQSPWKSFSTGVLYLVLMPLAAILLAATLIALPIGILCGGIYGLSLLFASATTATILTLWVEERADAIWNRTRLFLTACALLVAVKVLLFVPLFGWLFGFFIYSFSFGAMTLSSVRLFRQVVV